jgi:DNA polymerase delta subunit 2
MFLSCIAQSVEVDLMPGALDPALQIMPQQPIASVLLPQASHCTLFHPVTNPYWAKIGNRVVLGQAGQSLDDIMRYVDTSDRLAMAEQTLYWRHIAPTAPDTLWSYPFQDREPFLIDACPNIYFIGNQPKFETKLVQGMSRHTHTHHNIHTHYCMN